MRLLALLGHPVESVKAAVEAVAQQHELPADFLLTRKAIERLVERQRRGVEWTTLVTGWRAEVLAPGLTALFGQL